jgi:hypothetical protein
MTEQAEQIALAQDLDRLRDTLVHLRNLKTPPPTAPSQSAKAQPPSRPLFEYVPVSFLESVEWDSADQTPGPPGASQFDFLLAPPSPRTLAVLPPAEMAPRSPQETVASVELVERARTEESELPIDRADGFFQQFDWHDPLESVEPIPMTPPGTNVTGIAHSADFSRGFDDSDLTAPQLPANGAVRRAESTEPNPMTTTDVAFAEFSWE